MKILNVTRVVVGVLLTSAITLGTGASTRAFAESPRTPSSPGATVHIISPHDGDSVSSPFTVEFGLEGMTVAPAGTDKAGTGHHHLLIDGQVLPPMDKPMGKDGIQHFGGGQTQTELSLKPGEHTLQLILGDKNHVPHNPPVVSERITITVE